MYIFFFYTLSCMGINGVSLHRSKYIRQTQYTYVMVSCIGREPCDAALVAFGYEVQDQS